MSLSNSNRKAGLKKAQKMIPESRVVAYIVGRTGPQPVLAGLALLGGFVAISLLIMVATGAVLVPGLLVFVVVQHFLTPPRSLIVCDHGLALTKRSLLNGRPEDIVARLPHAAVEGIEKEAGRFRLDLGVEHIWLTKLEEGLLREALTPYLAAMPSYAAAH